MSLFRLQVCVAAAVAIVLLGGCQTDTSTPAERVHGRAGVQVKSHDTMGFRPEPGS